MRTAWLAVCGATALNGCASVEREPLVPAPLAHIAPKGYQGRWNDSRAELAPQVIDLETALRLGGVNNPTINLARERVQEARAGQLAARALLLPSVSVGGNFRHHRGAFIASQGIVRTPDLRSAYLGAGAGVSGGGSPAVPGVQLFANLGDAAYEPLAARSA